MEGDAKKFALRNGNIKIYHPNCTCLDVKKLTSRDNAISISALSLSSTVNCASSIGLVKVDDRLRPGGRVKSVILSRTARFYSAATSSRGIEAQRNLDRIIRDTQKWKCWR